VLKDESRNVAFIEIAFVYLPVLQSLLYSFGDMKYSRLFALAFIGPFCVAAHAQATVDLSWTATNTTFTEIDDGANYEFSIGAAYAAPPSGGSGSKSGTVAWELLVDWTGTSTGAPTASGSVEVGLDDGASAAAAAFANCSASSSASADSTGESASATGPGGQSNGPLWVGYPYNFAGSSLSFIQVSSNEWQATNDFHTTSLSASASATAPSGSKGSDGITSAEVNTEGSAGIVSNTLVVTGN